MGEYHPRRQDREIIDDNELSRILQDGKYVTIAMAKGNEPYIVTLSYGYDKENSRLYFHCALKGEKLDYIRNNSLVCATIVEDHGYISGQCHHTFSSLIIRGDMQIVEGLEEKKHGLGILINHLENDPEPVMQQHIPDDTSYDRVTVLRLDISSIVGKQCQ
jgi:nitroimidazol reductase NimA-like FMN-containing flavoprotein (pyridoxamine 5'-phosphate oxidase superfamily)